MKRLKTAMLNLFFPPKCIFCGRIIEADCEAICAECLATLKRPAEYSPLDYTAGVAAAAVYTDDVRSAIARYKFNGQTWLAEPFAELLAEAVRERLDGRFDTVTYVPLSHRRHRKRGYNQAQLLAEAVALKLEVPCVQALRKIRNTRENSSITGDEAAKTRKKNVANAYEALPDIGERRFLLIDDVLTTGSTASECARVLLAADAESVVVAAFALAGGGAKSADSIT